VGVPSQRTERTVEKTMMKKIRPGETQSLTLGKFSSYGQIFVRDPRYVAVEIETSVQVNAHDEN
jgi:hypothetical protein